MIRVGEPHERTHTPVHSQRAAQRLGPRVELCRDVRGDEDPDDEGSNDAKAVARVPEAGLEVVEESDRPEALGLATQSTQDDAFLFSSIGVGATGWLFSSIGVPRASSR